MNTTLDLTSPDITQEEYREAITALGTFLCEYARDSQWCRARHDYFRAIFPEYQRSEDYEYERNDPEPFEADWSKTPDKPYGESLALVRAHLLWYVRSNFTPLYRVNECFTRMGIPTYPDKVTPPVSRYQVYPGSIIVSASSPDMTDSDMQAWLADNAVTVMVAALNGRPIMTDKIAPGSFEVSGYTSEVYLLAPEAIPVQESDTVRPEYYRETGRG